MKIIPIIALLLCASGVQAAKPEIPDMAPCNELRAQIKAQVGELPKPDTVMLQRIGEHPECRFTATEVYRAAYGDRPMPQNKNHERRSRHHDHDDD